MALPRRWAVRGVLGFVGAVVLLVVVEAGLRVADYGFPTAFFQRQADGGARDNPSFGCRFFPPRMARMPDILQVSSATDKTFRVAILGGSAAMGEPLPEFGPARRLQAMLEAALPDKRVEVLNAAMTAIDSSVVREIAGDLFGLQPDVVILYLGNNEVVGPFGPAAGGGPLALRAGFTRLRVLATRLRLTQGIRRAMGWGAQADPWMGMERLEGRAIASDDPRLEAVAERFEANLRAIVRAARKAGSRVIICTVPVNLCDLPPFESVGGDANDPAFRSALGLLDDRRWPEAADAFRAWSDEHPRHAEGWFRWAQCLDPLGRTNEAYAAYARARDEDALRFRADSRIQAALRRIGGVSDVELLDIEAMARGWGPGSAPGNTVFCDHVHFTPEGAHRLAAAWCAAILGKPCSSPSSGAVDRRLLWTPLARWDFLDTLRDRFGRFPFRGQAGWRKRLVDRESACGNAAAAVQRMRPEDVARQAALVIASHPDDARLPVVAGSALLQLGGPSLAEPLLRQAAERWPYRLDVQGQLALMEGMRGRPERGLAAIESARARPVELAIPVLTHIARMLDAQGRGCEALPFVERAARLAPNALDIGLLKASLLASCGRIGEADAVLGAWSARRPDRPEPVEDRAALLLLRGEVEQALRLLDDLMTRFPDRAALRLKRALALLRIGEHDQALRCLDRAVELDPEDETLRAVRRRVMSEGPNER